MVQYVEELGAELHLQSLSDPQVLIEGEIPLFVGRADQRVASQVSVVPRTGDAVGLEARNRPVVGARHGKSRKVEELLRIVFVVYDRANYIRTIEAVATAAIDRKSTRLNSSHLG